VSDDKNASGSGASTTPRCPNCGTPLEQGFSECWSCGASVTNVSSESPLGEPGPPIPVSENEDDPLVTALAGRTPLERLRRRAFIAAIAWASVIVYPFVGIVLAPLGVCAHLIMARWIRSAQRSASHRPAGARIASWLFLTIAVVLTLIPFRLVAQNGSPHPRDDVAFALVAFGSLWALLAEVWLVIGLEQIRAPTREARDDRVKADS